MPDIYISQKPQGEPARKRSASRRHYSLDRNQKEEAGSFAGYATHPADIRFENQERGEEIELFLRQHPITNVPWITFAVLMIFAPLLLQAFPFLGFLPSRFQLVTLLIWYLLTSAFILENLLRWLFNIYIVTNRRIIDIDFHNLIYKEVSDTNLNRVQDVTYRMGGVVRTLFNYGDVLIQTAGAAPNFEFGAVPNPDQVVKTLQELRHKAGKGRRV